MFARSDPFTSSHNSHATCYRPIATELFKDTTAKTLPVSAFLVTTSSAFTPLSNDFEELAKVVRAVFQEMYSYRFADTPDYDFVGVYLPRYTVVSPTLVDFEVNVYFSNKELVPSLFEVEGVAKQGFQPGAEFFNILLGKMRMMQSKFYSQATTVQYITNTQDLNLAVITLANDNTYTVGQLILIVMLTLFGAAFFALCLLLLLKKRRNQKRTHVHEELSPLEVKMNKGSNYTDATSQGGESVTTLKSEAQQQMSPRPQPKNLLPPMRSVAHSPMPSSPRTKLLHRGDDSEDDDDFILDENLTFDEVALEDEAKPDAKTCIGEIRKSAYVNDHMVTSRTQPREDTANRTGELSRRPAPDTTSTSDTPNTDGNASQETEDTKTRIAEINKAKYKNKVTRSVPVDPAYPGTPKPWHTTGALHPVPESPESPHGASPFDAPQRIFHASTPAAGRASSNTKSSAGADDDASVMTIDSQSSATPEFLKKFKQMGLKRPKGDS